jgi:hypothetical protein
LTFFKFGAKVTVSGEKAKEKNGELLSRFDKNTRLAWPLVSYFTKQDVYLNTSSAAFGHNQAKQTN